jgi:hypothetical protein
LEKTIKTVIASIFSSNLEVQSALGGVELTPFYNLLEGGRSGLLFKEMKELFYYSQLRQ